MFRQLSKISTAKQFLISIGLIILVAAICYIASDFIEYKVVAFILLLTVSLIALVFNILPVLTAAALSALIWNFFFIHPKFTFYIGSTEDGILFLMYFVIAFINGVLTNRIRKVEKQAREEEEKAKTVKLYNSLYKNFYELLCLFGTKKTLR